MSRYALPAGLIALAIIVWTVPLQLVALWSHDQINPDVWLYFDYAARIGHGAVPYRDFHIEYPPGATGLFMLGWITPIYYQTAFTGLMLICECICIAGVVACARALGMSPLRQGISGGVVALSPLLLGSLVQARFDMAVAAIVSWMIFAAITERWRLMWVLLALGVLIKIIPIALVPLLLLWQAHRRGWTSAIRGAALALVIVIVGILPFAILSPSGTWYFVAYNLRRPPQIESMAASIYLAGHALLGVRVHLVRNYGSFGLSGKGPAVLALLLTVALVVVVVLVAAWCARLFGRAYRDRDVRILVAGAATTIAALTVTGKVLSPQYMIWLLPVAVIVPGRYGPAVLGTMVAAMLLTQAFFPLSYLPLLELHRTEIGWLVLRNLSLIVLMVLCWPREELGTLPIEGHVIGTNRDPRTATGPPTSVPARHIVD